MANISGCCMRPYYCYVPRDLMERPKMDFAVPIEHWLQGSLWDWGEDLIDESRLLEDGHFYPVPIRKKMGGAYERSV